MATTTASTIEYAATGRRKTSVARVRLVPGDGKFVINHRPIEAYLTVPTLRSVATQALDATDSAKKYNVSATVEGGGISGQAGAIRHAIARALLQAAPDLKGALRDKGFLTRDSRMKERKKYGQPGARKRFQFSKR